MNRFTLPEGATVKFDHRRRYEDDIPFIPQAQGGYTIARVTLADGTEHEGVAVCYAKENYSKKIGRDVSLGRALAAIATREKEEVPS